MSKKKRIILSDAELLTYSAEHLHYEIAMCIGGGGLLFLPFKFESELKIVDKATTQSVVKSALLEAFIVHLRNLIDFLYPTRDPSSSDVIADDFFTNLRLQSFPPLPKKLEEARLRAHKQVAHLTSERLPEGDPGKEWKYGELMSEIGRILHSFVDQASPNKLHPSVRDLVRLAIPKGSDAANA